MAGGADAVRAIVAKDLRLFARDRFYAFVSVLGIVAYAALFWALPATVEATIGLGVHLPGGEALLQGDLDAAGEEGFDVAVFDSSSALENAVAEGDDVVAGLDFPEGFLQATMAGEATTVRVLLAGEAPVELRDALTALVREVAFALSGEEPPVTIPDAEEIVLGVDRADDPVPLRDELRPLLIFLVLMVEMFALASLVAVEIAQRTVSAVLVTPARVIDLLAAKGLLGTGLAFSQALLLALVTGALLTAPGVLVVALLLGAVLVTGFGLIAGSIGKDFVAIVFWSVLFFIPLAIPAFSLLFPGSPGLAVRVLPTYGLAEALLRATAHGAGFAETWPHLALLAAWGAAAFVAGAVVLGWRAARA
jgi:ABC-2 type transport system permease protein